MRNGIGSTNCANNLDARAKRRRGETPRSIPKILRVNLAFVTKLLLNLLFYLPIWFFYVTSTNFLPKSFFLISDQHAGGVLYWIVTSYEGDTLEGQMPIYGTRDCIYASMSSTFVLVALASITSLIRKSPLIPNAYLSRIRPSVRASKLPS